MSADVIQLVCSVNRNSINMQIALQCAPLLMGVKISNLFTTNSKNEYIVKQLFENSLFSGKIIYKSNEKIIFLLYQEEKLVHYLSGEYENSLLKILGYSQMNLQEILNEFAKRFTGYMEEKKKFPHELGLLLEYPVADVIGFMDNEGKNFLYTGYWKVYENLQQALKRFETYDVAKETVIRMVAQGVSIQHILEIYNSSYKQLAI
ncbi:MAG: DUF3793 family protein [Lachnotalea sp.]